MRFLLCVIGLASLSACATTSATSAAPADTAPQGVPALPRCTQAVLAPFIGQPKTDMLAAKLLAATGAREIRWVPVGMMVNMIYQYDRLTVRLGPDLRITQASCN